MLAMLTFPMAIGLAAIAPTLIDLLLPPGWQGVAPFLVILAACPCSVPSTASSHNISSRWSATACCSGLEVLRVVALFGGLLLLGQIGPLAAAFAVGGSAIIYAGGLILAIGSGSFLRSMFTVLRAPAISSLTIVAAVMTTRSLFPPADGYNEVVVLIAEIIAGVCVYVSCMLLLGRGAVSEMLALAKGSLRLSRL